MTFNKFSMINDLRRIVTEIFHEIGQRRDVIRRVCGSVRSLLREMVVHGGAQLDAYHHHRGDEELEDEEEDYEE
ncbi:unnamed protein product [Sphagnum balticum]